MSEKRYMLLNEGERIEERDEYYAGHLGWAGSSDVGKPVPSTRPYRRLLPDVPPDLVGYRRLYESEDVERGDVFTHCGVCRKVDSCPSEERCGTCRYWRAPVMEGETVRAKNWTEPTCRRYPVHVRAESGHWCGEWRGKVGAG